jgi:hypothetical protein
VQTFLPFPEFDRCAEVLDQRRLGKQRVECLQVANALRVPGHGWRHHPVVRMWDGHEEALLAYTASIVRAWLRLDFADTCLPKISDRLTGVALLDQAELAEAGLLPPWLGHRDLHRSHQSALVRKDPDHYRPFFPDVPDDLPYVWPVPKPAA